MKQSLKFILLTIFIGILFFLGFKIALKIKFKNEIAQKTKSIPEFIYQDLKTGIFTNKNLKKETSTIFIYFNTECFYCEEEAKMIKENIDKLPNSQILFVSNEKKEIIAKFAQKYQLNIYENVHFLCDKQLRFATTFDVNSFPSIIIYDKQNNLVRKIKGQIKIEKILEKATD